MQLKISEFYKYESDIMQAVALIFLMLHTLFTLVQYQLKLSKNIPGAMKFFKVRIAISS